MLHDPIITPRALRRSVAHARAEERAAHNALTQAQRRVKLATENRVELERMLERSKGAVAFA